MAHPRHDELNWSEMSIKDILELAIADEEEAKEYYRRAAELTGNVNTRRLLLSLSAMEDEHARQLRRELEELLLEREEETGMAD